VEIQRWLAPRVVREGGIGEARLVAGADAAFSPDRARCIAAVVVWDVAERRVVEQRIVRRVVRFPYVPGLLTFREAPALLQAIRGLRSHPDVFIFDGQGYAHPRRFGLASHVGVWIDRPSIGCAKSLLVGEYEEPRSSRGSMTALLDRGDRIGTVLRTRDGVKPVYVSVGHQIGLGAACALVQRCCTQYRLPEPTRLADQLAGRERFV